MEGAGGAASAREFFNRWLSLRATETNGDGEGGGDPRRRWQVDGVVAQRPTYVAIVYERAPRVGPMSFVRRRPPLSVVHSHLNRYLRVRSVLRLILVLMVAIAGEYVATKRSWLLMYSQFALVPEALRVMLDCMEDTLGLVVRAALDTPKCLGRMGVTSPSLSLVDQLPVHKTMHP